MAETRDAPYREILTIRVENRTLRYCGISVHCYANVNNFCHRIARLTCCLVHSQHETYWSICQAYIIY